MRKLLLSSAVMMAVATVSFAGQAAETASLSVTGTISPSSCDITLSAASIDLGTVAASTLTETANLIKGKDVTVNVDCNAPSAIAVQTTDNRTSSAMTMAELDDQMQISFGSGDDTQLFGLGTDSASAKIGTMLLAINSSTLNGTTNANLLNSTDKATWTAKAISSTSGMLLNKGGYFASAANANTTTPAAVTTATYNVSSAMYLKGAAKYPTGEAVDIDGNVTFSVVYL